MIALVLAATPHAKAADESDANASGLVNTHVVMAGMVPNHTYAVQDYWGEGSHLESRAGAIAATYQQGKEVGKLLGQLDVFAELFASQSDSDFSAATPSIHYPVTEADLSPVGVRGQVSFLVDPTTRWFGHRLPGGAWMLGVGFSPTLDLCKATYKDELARDQTVTFTSAFLQPTLGAHAALFHGAVVVGWQGMASLAQFGVWNLMADTSATSALDQLAEDGKLADPGEAAKSAGISGVLARSAGTGRFDGASSSTLTVMVGLPTQGTVFDNAYGLGFTFYGSKQAWVPFGTAWKATEDQSRFETANHGILVALAFRSAVRYD